MFCTHDSFWGYAVFMRYRRKFGAQGWCWVALGSMWLFFAVYGHNRSGHGINRYTAAIWALLALQQVLNYLFTYWEMDSSSFRLRYFWTTKEVAWEEVKRVHGANDQPSSSRLEVDYSRPAPMSDRGQVLANPDDRRGFIKELRRFASQAEFEV